MKIENLSVFAMGFSTCAALAALVQGRFVLMAANLFCVALNFAFYHFVLSGNSKP